MMRIDKIEPTVLFIRKDNGLLRLVNVTVENAHSQEEAVLDISGVGLVPLGKLEKGKNTCPVYIPDIRECKPVEFILKVNEEIHDRRSINWKPGRHWQIYMVPISHHDLGYTDTIENVLNTYNRFYEDILRFCEETEDWPEESKFRYMVEGAWSIQHFIGTSPKETIEKLAKYIKQGRIEVSALFGNEISGLCSHEELIRLMYPSFRIKRGYGARISSASITDIPGLSWGLPTVLSGAGVRYFFAGLPTYFQWGRSDIHTFWDEAGVLRPHGRPDAFRWRGPDGGTVLVYYQGGYGCWSPSSYEEVYDQLPKMLNELEEKGCPFSVLRFGGYGCGDNTPPDIRVSYVVKEWNSRWAYPKLIVATNSMFFEELEKQCQDVRTFSGELPDTDYVVGATSAAKETGINRTTHDRLHSAEKFATIAELIGNYPYPAESIRNAYDNMLLYDEHTWGMAHQVGHVQDWAWSEKSHYAYKAEGLTELILSESLDAIARSVSLKEPAQYILVFNPLSFQRTDIVSVHNFLVEGSFDLINEETGAHIPYQIVELDSPQAPVPYSAQRYARGLFSKKELFDLVFVAEDVPPMGYKAYRIEPKSESPAFKSDIIVGETFIENRFFKVMLNPDTGAVESIYDKELSYDYVDKTAPHLLNQLVVRWVESGKAEGPQKAEIRRGQNGPVYGSIVASSSCAGCPQLTQEIILYDRIKRIGFANRILKDSTPAMELYFAFPFKIDTPDFRFEGGNSVIKPLRDQFPGSNSNYYAIQHWADVYNGSGSSSSKGDLRGITFSSIEAHLVEFGGLWHCYVSQAHHGVTPPDFGRDFVKPGEMTKGYIYSFVLDSNFRTNFQPTQQGDMLFHYFLGTHRGDWKEGKARDFGWAVSNPLIPVPVRGRKEGTLPSSMSFCQLNRPNVLLLTLKKAENGEGIIIRLIETEGNDSEVTLTLPHIAIKKAYLTNLVEEDEKVIPAQRNAITIPIKAFGIATVRILMD